MKTQNSEFILPEHLSAEAAEMFNQIRDERGIDESRWLQVLLQAVESWERAEGCRRQIEADGGPLVLDRFKQPKPHPLLIPERQSRLAFARLLASLPFSLKAMR